MKPRAFELTCWRLCSQGAGALPALERIVTALATTPEKYARYISGEDPVPEFPERSLARETAAIYAEVPRRRTAAKPDA